MPNQTIKYLQQYESSTLDLEGLNAERSRLMDMLYPGSSNPTGKISGSGSHDHIGDGVSSMVDVVRDIDEEIKHYISVRDEVRSVVRAVMHRNIVWGQCLHYRYIMFEDPKACAFHMGYPDRSERRIHKLAIKEAQRIIDEREKTTANDRSARDIV